MVTRPLRDGRWYRGRRHDGDRAQISVRPDRGSSVSTACAAMNARKTLVIATGRAPDPASTRPASADSALAGSGSETRRLFASPSGAPHPETGRCGRGISSADFELNHWAPITGRTGQSVTAAPRVTPVSRPGPGVFVLASGTGSGSAHSLSSLARLTRRASAPGSPGCFREEKEEKTQEVRGRSQKRTKRRDSLI
jgi:hypothetical protein